MMRRLWFLVKTNFSPFSNCGNRWDSGVIDGTHKIDGIEKTFTTGRTDLPLPRLPNGTNIAGAIAIDDVVEHIDTKKLSCFGQSICHLDIFPARFSISGWVIVGKDDGR